MELLLKGSSKFFCRSSFPIAQFFEYFNNCLKPFSSVGPEVKLSPWVSHGGHWSKRSQGENITKAVDCLLCSKKKKNKPETNGIFFQNAMPGSLQDCPNSSLRFKQLIPSLIFVPQLSHCFLWAAPHVMNPRVLAGSSPLVFPNNAFLSEIL